MPSEIGSEFWDIELSKVGNPIIENTYQFLLSGRTALDFIIKDTNSSKAINAVHMPTYCCQAMLQPFLDNGIPIEFYNVNLKNRNYFYEINIRTKCDIVFVMQYFGYYNETVGQAIKRLKDNGKIVIEDATHSWFSDNPYSKYSDYVFASFRKWTGLPGGAIVIKRNDCFSAQSPINTNHKYILLREQAAKLKRQYIVEGRGQKKAYLKLFKQAENLLDKDYQDYNIPDEYRSAITSLNAELIRQKRKANAAFLVEGLKNHKDIEYIPGIFIDTPLFVPIIIHNGKRDVLRQYLIDNNIYCPVHWPKPFITNKNFMNENSLSLVCDQRYNLSDMRRIIDCIIHFFED